METAFSAYKALLQSKPILTKSITCGLLFIVGDYIAQKGNQLDIQLRISSTVDGINNELLTLPSWELLTTDRLCIFGTARCSPR
jgi:hypothetical protein